MPYWCVFNPPKSSSEFVKYSAEYVDATTWNLENPPTNPDTNEAYWDVDNDFVLVMSVKRFFEGYGYDVYHDSKLKRPMLFKEIHEWKHPIMCFI